MPQTPIYGLPSEALGDQPGHSLHGGTAGLDPILAEEVEKQLSRVDGDISNIENVVIPGLEAQATSAQVLGVIDSGQGTNTTEFTNIDQNYRDLMILWRGASDGSGQIDSLALRFNGDGGDNYISAVNRNTEAGDFSSGQGTFSVLRAGHVGTSNSCGVVHIPYYGVPSNVQSYGSSASLSQAGNVFITTAGGRWSDSGPVTSIRIWVSGQLWRFEPHITLIGFREA